MIEDAVALDGARDREPDAADLFPREAVLPQVLVNRRDPAGHDSGRAVVRAGRALQQLCRDGLSIGPDRAHLRGRGAAVGSEESLARRQKKNLPSAPALRRPNRPVAYLNACFTLLTAAMALRTI